MPPVHVPWVSVAELAAGSAGLLPELDEDGQVTDPLVVVEVDGQAPAALLERAAERAGDSGRILVGIASGPLPARARPLLAALDLTLAAAGDGRECVTVPDPQGQARLLAAAAAGSPQASLVLRQVLRMTAVLPAGAGLEAESLAYSALLGGGEFRRWRGARGPRPLPPAAGEPVLVHRDGPLLLVTLNHAERRNAYSRRLRDALADALRVALLDPTVERVVLAGAGSCFCSGGDLDEFGRAPDPVTAHFVRTQAGAGPLLRMLGGRVEARVHGACVGAGVELAAFAGTVTAAPDATFWLPEIGMGLIPGAGGTVSVPGRIGRWRTMYLALSGQPVDAATALAWGLVDRVAGPASLA